MIVRLENHFNVRIVPNRGVTDPRPGPSNRIPEHSRHCQLAELKSLANG